MTPVLNVLLLVISVCLGFVEVADSSDTACLGACQAELATANLLPGSSGDTGDSASEAVINQRKLCELFGKVKECFLACDGGSDAWTQFSSGEISPVLQSCGPAGGAGDSSSSDFQDMICAQGCQLNASEKISKAVPQGPPTGSGEPGSGANSEAYLEQNRQICAAEDEMKQCIIGCKGGQKIWETQFDTFVSSCSSGPGGIEANTCAFACQQQQSDKLLPRNRDATSVTDFDEERRKMCSIFEEIKSCVLKCDGGKDAWNNVVKHTKQIEAGGGGSIIQICGLGDGPGDFSVDLPSSAVITSDGDLFSDMFCALTCQLAYESKSSSIVNGPDPEYLKIAGEIQKLCDAMNEFKDCLPTCGQVGQQLWDEAFKNGSMIDVGIGTLAQTCFPDGDGGPLADLSCATTCQSVYEGKTTSVINGPDTESLDEAASSIQQVCDVLNEFKDCLATCGQVGQRLWDEAFVNNSKIDVGIGTLVQTCFPDGDGGPLSGLFCATTCQSAYEGNISGFESRPDPESLEEIASGIKHFCDATNDVKDCLATCGQTGQRLWEDAYMNGSLADIGIGSFACFPDQVADEVLENYQCFVGTCTKCSDMPLEQCLPDFLTYPSKSACEDSKCGKIGQEDNYNICKMDNSTLGASEINLQCNPKVPAPTPAPTPGCPPAYACLPIEAFGAHYCCPDSPEQAQILCIQKCKSFISSRQSKLFALINQPDAFHESACSIYEDEKECMLKCPSGQQGYQDYQQTQQSFKGYQNLVNTCGSSGSGTPSAKAQSVKRDAATSETSPEVAEYCRRILNQKNGDTAFCKYQSFAETCKNVCPQ